MIPLVFPLKIKKSRPENTPLIPLLKEGEMTWLLPPLLVREGRGGIGLIAIFHEIDTPSHWL
jgi:hypothetical protein